MLRKSTRRTISSEYRKINSKQTLRAAFSYHRDMRSFWRKLGELGYLGITVDPEYGGTGGSYLDHSIVVEEISRYVNKFLTKKI